MIVLLKPKVAPGSQDSPHSAGPSDTSKAALGGDVGLSKAAFPLEYPLNQGLP